MPTRRLAILALLATSLGAPAQDPASPQRRVVDFSKPPRQGLLLLVEKRFDSHVRWRRTQDDIKEPFTGENEWALRESFLNEITGTRTNRVVSICRTYGISAERAMPDRHELREQERTTPLMGSRIRVRWNARDEAALTYEKWGTWGTSRPAGRHVLNRLSVAELRAPILPLAPHRRRVGTVWSTDAKALCKLVFGPHYGNLEGAASIKLVSCGTYPGLHGHHAELHVTLTARHGATRSSRISCRWTGKALYDLSHRIVVECAGTGLVSSYHASGGSDYTATSTLTTRASGVVLREGL